MANIDPVIAEILKSQGRLEAQVAMLMAESCDSEEAESESEYDSGGPELATNPAINSPMLEFDIPPIF
jgi:hypothetical protein